MRYSGIIEGFYGADWSHTSRLSYAQFLARVGYDCYIYAPKSDRCLRADWRSLWPQQRFDELRELASSCVQQGIRFGVGLTPLGAVGSFDTAMQDLLSARLSQIESLDSAVLCVLFDDLPGGDPNLAEHQLAICAFIEQRLPSTDLVMCPSYYSNDPILEQVFGKMPAAYWAQLGAGLSSRWSIFWTGDRVVSLDYHVDELGAIAAQFKRKPLIWDNYPVNDGKKLCSFLNLEGRDRSSISASVDGILHNPMNQAMTSQLALARMKGLSESEIATLLRLPEVLQSCLARDSELFQKQGLARISDSQRQQLYSEYTTISHPIATEVGAWLAGDYAFDPACLT